MELVGSFYVLAVLPIWATALVLITLLLVAMFVGRDYFEGMPYQVSYSAQIGDAGLFIVVLIAAGILQQGDLYVPRWLMSAQIHLAMVLVVFALGLIVNESRHGKEMDTYHDVVIVPLFLYLAVTLLPVIYLNGTVVEKWTTAILVLLWAVLVVFDVVTNRMNQRKWLEEKGVQFD